MKRQITEAEKERARLIKELQEIATQVTPQQKIEWCAKNETHFGKWCAIRIRNLTHLIAKHLCR